VSDAVEEVDAGLRTAFLRACLGFATTDGELILRDAVGGNTEVTEVLEELHRVTFRKNPNVENLITSWGWRNSSQERRNSLWSLCSLGVLCDSSAGFGLGLCRSAATFDRIEL
jgi:hypothetical protein